MPKAMMMTAAALALALSAVSPFGARAQETGFSGAYLAAASAARSGDVAEAASRYLEALSLDPENPQLLEAALVNLIAAGRVEEAPGVATRLLEHRPQHRVAGLVAIVEAIRAHQFETARSEIASRVDTPHPLVRALFSAWVAFGSDDLVSAEAAIGGLDQRNVFNVFADYHLGLMRMLEGDHAGAVEKFDSAIEVMGRSAPRIGLARAAALVAQGRRVAARAALEQGVRDGLGEAGYAAALAALDANAPWRPLVADSVEGAAEALYGVAGLLGADQGRRVALIYARLALYLRPDLHEAHALIAEIFEQDDRWELAAQSYEAIPADHPLALRAEIGRAGALESLDRAEAAAEALRALTVREPESVEAHMALGDLLRRSERWAEAASAYTIGIDLLAERGRENWAAFYQRGICHERAGLWERAEADFKKALELRPDQPLVLNYLGYSWVEMGRNLDEAREMIERAVELRPSDGYITDSLGWVLYQLGDFEGAVEWLEKAVELTPVDPIVNDHLGDAYWRVGRRREAEFQWRRARSFDPEPEDLARIRRKLDVGLDQVLAEESGVIAEPEAISPNDG